MFTKTAQYYDLVYSFKDYAQEVQKIRALIETERPGARTVLGVACGTGEHAELLGEHFAVDGLDLEDAFVSAGTAEGARRALRRRRHAKLQDGQEIRCCSVSVQLDRVPDQGKRHRFSTQVFQ